LIIAIRRYLRYHKKSQLMNRYLTFGAVLCLLFSACDALIAPQDDLADQNIVQVFSSPEVKTIAKVVAFMDSTVFVACNCQSVQEGYSEFFSNPTFSEPSFNEGALEGLIKEMKAAGLFFEFWTVRRVNAPDSLKGVYLDFNMNGKLFKLVESVGQDEESIGEYYGYLMRDRNISPSLIALFPYDYSNVNYKRPGVRLIIAAHFIFLAESKKYSIKKVKPFRIEDTGL